jgi:hypothetical protein
MGRMSQTAERQAWTDFVEHGNASSIPVKLPGVCATCSEQIPPRRLEKKMKTCSVACGRKMQSAKYGGRKVEFNGRWYDSEREARHASLLQLLEERKEIFELKYQVRIVLVAARPPLKAITYIADFTYWDRDRGRFHVVDVKGFKTQIYRLKKRAAALLLGLEIEEV